MNLKEIGFNEKFEKFSKEIEFSGFEIGRIITEHKERYIVITKEGEFDAEITGNMRFTAKGRIDFPAVGDWVAVTSFDDIAIIHKILPRFSILKRKAVGQLGEIQIIATNIDYAFIMQAATQDFNINRLERYLTICNTSKVKPVIVISKVDLIDQTKIDNLKQLINSRIDDVLIFAISNESKFGYEEILNFMQQAKTYCLLGSSGVGKSTLLNNLLGKNIMRTEEISHSTNKGRHITSHRELFVLENGAILIDNPGMREIGIADSGNGLEITFDPILKLAIKCKYKDCTHTSESGCAVLQALDNGIIDQLSYQNYLKMLKEKEHFESSALKRKQKDKEFGKMLKNYKKDIKRNKF
jgi:ribosome biogenesis GTPase